MLGGVLDALGAAALARDALVVVSTDNGAPGTPEGVKPSRFDPVTIEAQLAVPRAEARAVRGRRAHVRAALVAAPAAPPARRRRVTDWLSTLFHVTDWLPTLLALAGPRRLGDDASSRTADDDARAGGLIHRDARRRPPRDAQAAPLDGVDQLGCVATRRGRRRGAAEVTAQHRRDVRPRGLREHATAANCKHAPAGAPSPTGLIHRARRRQTNAATLKLLVGCGPALRGGRRRRG